MLTGPASSITTTKAVRAVASFSERYCRTYLGEPYSPDTLEKDWWSGLGLFLNHSFYQGRLDEVSERVEGAAMPVLKAYFATLAPAQLPAADFVQLGRDLEAVIGKGKIGKRGDVKMLVSIFEFVSRLPETNLTRYSTAKIRESKLESHYYELQDIWQIGPKVASFYLRDLVCIYDLDNSVKSNELIFLQPIDVWVRKVAHRFGIIADENCPEDQVRSRIIETCAQAGVSAFKFNQGAWYIGKNAFDIVIERLDQIISA